MPYSFLPCLYTELVCHPWIVLKDRCILVTHNNIEITPYNLTLVDLGYTSDIFVKVAKIVVLF